jgi:aspartyl-tRNA(Asn)/glutamyl-tRNA(Gln) amidotransferase subunit A
MGGTGTTGHTGVVHNPWDLNRMAAGSSAGSAASVASGVYPFALGSDTGTQFVNQQHIVEL